MWKLYTYIHTQYTHTHTQYGIIAIKNNEIRSFAATWMDLEISILSDVIQTEKNKYHMISLIVEPTEKIKKIQTGDGGKLGIGINIYTLL